MAGNHGLCVTQFAARRCEVCLSLFLGEWAQAWAGRAGVSPRLLARDPVPVNLGAGVKQ